MSQSHYWFATDADFKVITRWLADAGAEPAEGTFDALPTRADGRVLLRFPAIGGITFWPEVIDLSAYPAGSQRWKRALLAWEWMKDHPGRRMINSEFSAVATLCPPYKREGRFWTSGELHFKGSHLKDRFPQLNSLCSKFGRWLAKQQLVYDNTKKERYNPFEYNLCMCGYVKRIFAFPEAYRILAGGGVMVDWSANDFVYDKFKRSLELRGVVIEPNSEPGAGSRSPAPS
jgi:hypothetical protein